MLNDTSNTPRLHPEDIGYLHTRGITEKYALHEGLVSLPDHVSKGPLTQYGIGKVPCGGLLIPYTFVRGTYRLRLRQTTFHSSAVEGSNLLEETKTFPKFYASKGKEVVPYFPRDLQSVLADTTKPLFISEGPIKAISLTAHGFPCVGLGGVEAGYHDVAEAHETGHLALNEEMKRVDWRGRTVYVVSDAGRQCNASVARGEAKLARILREAGANVMLVQLPWASTEPREGALYQPLDQGPDDYIARHSKEAFQALVNAAVPANPIAWAATVSDPVEVDRLLNYLPFQAALAVGGSSAQSGVQKAWKLSRKPIKDAVQAYTDRAIKKNGPEWTKDMFLSKEGTPTPTLANILLVLRNDEQLRGRLAVNEFANVLLWKEPPPWRTKAGPLIDADVVALAEYLQTDHALVVRTNMVAEAFTFIGEENKFHPVRTYFNELKWDGTKRLDNWLVSYLGVKDTSYTRAIGSKWLIGGVARIMQPGCKMDTMLILEGGQGEFKSTVFNVLASDEWFLDDIRDIGTKDACEQLAGHLIVEMGELAAMSRSDAEANKRFVTTKIDTYRAAYGRYKQKVPRQNIFAGSTNQGEYLKDETGNRRFWPVEVGKIDLEALTRDRDQIWAEAVHKYRAGTKWWFTSEETSIIEEALEEQESRRQVHPWETIMAVALEGKNCTSVSEVLDSIVKQPRDRWTMATQVLVGKCFTALGWTRHRGPRPQRLWFYLREGWSMAPDSGLLGPGGRREPLPISEPPEPRDLGLEDPTSPSELGLAPVVPEKSIVELCVGNFFAGEEAEKNNSLYRVGEGVFTGPAGTTGASSPSEIEGTLVDGHPLEDGSWELQFDCNGKIVTVTVSPKEYAAMVSALQGETTVTPVH